MTHQVRATGSSTSADGVAAHPAYCSTVHVDVMTIPQPLDKIGDLARRVQASGFSGLLFTETGRTAYLNPAVALQAAPGLELLTGVAVAFPRSPFVTAATAWELQEATGGSSGSVSARKYARMSCGAMASRSSIEVQPHRVVNVARNRNGRGQAGSRPLRRHPPLYRSPRRPGRADVRRCRMKPRRRPPATTSASGPPTRADYAC
jgi:Luciferase-like monooxygenase